MSPFCNVASRAHGGPAGAARAGTPAAPSGMRASSPPLSSNARSSSISPGRAVSNMQGSRMNGSALARSRTGTQISAGSSLGKSASSHTGANNSAFASARGYPRDREAGVPNIIDEIATPPTH